MQQVYELFAQAVALPPLERSAFLANACPNDPELRLEVTSLLEHDSRATRDFMPTPAPDSFGAPPAPLRRAATLIGSRVGGFEIKAVIAVGGMGSVYEAEQQEPRRRVALKIMKGEVTSHAALRRFQFEAQILGRLRHPNVAQIYQAGMHDDGRIRVPYFAMEYIPEAQPITRYAEQAGLDLRGRLRLFANVCDAVHHGHQRGIIHRDLKPANILVDAAGEPKVIDFGVARATDADVSATTQQTYVGQLVGTVQYMSPEQCDADPHDLDTRSDVYSLGVVLFELLTGALPYNAADTTLYAATRAIKEETPRRPSAINRRLRGDTETIVLKALEKDRDRRYQSAADLAQDIRRRLNGEPIEARAPTAWTRGVRWIARNPLVTTAVACVTIAGLVMAGTYLSIEYLHNQPHYISFWLDPERDYGNYGPEAQLLARSGKPLKTWNADKGLRFAGLVDRPAALGGRKLALLGFTNAQSSPYPGAFCAYDIHRDLDRPIWQRRIETADVPAVLREYRGAVGEQFRVQNAWVYDVFPESEYPEYPGKEIVVWYSRWYYSQGAICIYNLKGELLYQVWHDGIEYACRWMADAGLLVFAGDCHWPHYSREGKLLGSKPRDYVVFALRPEPGFVAREFLDYLARRAGDERLDPVWYLRLRPDDWSHSAVPGFELTLDDPDAPNQPGSSAEVDVRLDKPTKAYIRWVIDASGHEVPGSRVLGDSYKRNQRLPKDHPDRLDFPEPDEIKLVPMTLADVLPGSSYVVSGDAQ